MDIVFFLEEFHNSPFIINQIAHLQRQGHDVFAIADRRADQERNFSAELVEQHGMMNRVRFVTTPDTYAEALQIVASVLPAALSEDAVDNRELVGLLQHWKRFPVELARLKTLLNCNQEFDIYHAHFGHVGRRWSFLSELGDFAPFITTFYGLDVSKMTNFDGGRRLYEDFWSQCDCAISISRHIQSRTIMLGCPEAKTRQLHIGVNTSDFEFQHTSYEQGEMLQLLSIARMVEKKGLKYAIEAVSKCIDMGIDVEYRIAGDGHLREALETQIANAGIEESVTLLGWQGQPEVRQLLRDSHLVIQPSVPASNWDMEGQVLALQEAQAMGVPVIGTYHDGIPEGINEKVTGRLVPERDVTALTEAINFFYDTPSAVGEYSRSARDYIEAHFNNESLIQEQINIYRSLL